MGAATAASGRYRESAADAPDADLLRDRLAEDGYLFFPGLIEREAVLALRAEFLCRLQAAGWLAPGSKPEDALPEPRLRRENTPQFWEGYSALQRIQQFHELAHAPAIMKVMRALLGPQVLVHPRKIARVNYPDHPEHTTSAHQDYRYVQGATDTLTAWAPLGDCPPDLGGIRILAGSHRLGLLPAVAASGGDGGLAVEVDHDDQRWVGADYRAGDVVVFHSLTVHSGVPNRSRQLRLSVDCRYQSVEDPVTPESLLPHFYSDVARWAELTSGWSSWDAIIPPPVPLRICQLRPLQGALELPASRFLAGRRPMTSPDGADAPV